MILRVVSGIFMLPIWSHLGFSEDVQPVPNESADPVIQQARDVLVKGQSSLPEPEQIRIGKAVAALDVLLAKQPAAEVSEKLDLKTLKGIIKGRFAVKGDLNDEIMLTYTWAGEDVKDWTIEGAEPTVAKGALNVGPGVKITHKLRFKSIKVAGEVSFGNKEGDHVGSTNGISLTVGNYNAWFVNLMVGGARIGQATFDKDYVNTSSKGAFIPFTITQEKGALSVTWKDQKLGTPSTAAFGSLYLSGGIGGNAYKPVTMTGTLDRAWVKSALESLAMEKAQTEASKKR